MLHVVVYQYINLIVTFDFIHSQKLNQSIWPKCYQ